MPIPRVRWAGGFLGGDIVCHKGFKCCVTSGACVKLPLPKGHVPICYISGKAMIVYSAPADELDLQKRRFEEGAYGR